ncbi:hypothetical protein cce_3182 [Crocosphaera subtropica ATCC 51142]|uniref:Uncharacterized protein n=1 Tax=Crocosphaera subtropica (strain ATCC 51142 / BH68) TaxID=43989 RepID=B1WXI9_CROS5|nr:hypothetical protein [Crocosphaera subtropica]ACB52530.1 hypothetical protein cce_3182 [Crocosphaera subtropica ATCC 51142]
MTDLGKVLVFMAMGVVIAKFVASFFGKGNIPWLNKLVTIILCLFIGFEVYQIGKLLINQP